jgi:hypothetical protein
MIRKLCIAFPLMIFFLLAGCAEGTTSSQVVATEPAATIVITFATPDQSFATPIVGVVTVMQIQKAKGVFLRCRPDSKAPVAGEVKPGDSGKALGVDSSGKWMLVTIKDQTGWALVQLLNYTISQ